MTAIHDVDDFVAAADGDELAAWLVAGDALGGEPVRCGATGGDATARQRLDLSLRMLGGPPAAQWCRAAGTGSAVVRRWDLPARVVGLYRDGVDAPVALVLAVGRPGAGVDLWRFRFDEPSASVLDRGRALLAT